MGGVKVEYVTIYLDHANIGCGFRRALVVSKGPKWVKLLYPAGLVTVTLSRVEFDASKAVPVTDYDRAALGCLIDNQVLAAALGGYWNGGNAAQECLRYLHS